MAWVPLPGYKELLARMAAARERNAAAEARELGLLAELETMLCLPDWVWMSAPEYFAGLLARTQLALRESELSRREIEVVLRETTAQIALLESLIRESGARIAFMASLLGLKK